MTLSKYYDNTYYWRLDKHTYRFQTTNPKHRQQLRRYVWSGQGMNCTVSLYDVPADKLRVGSIAKIVSTSILLS